jgi:hypothetical protein
MNIDEKLRKYLGTDIEPLNEQMSDDELVNSMVEFLLELDEENLSDEMSVRLHDILNELDSGEEGEDEDTSEDEDDVNEVRLLKKTNAKGRRKSKMYYRKNKAKIRAKLRKLKPKIARMEKMGKGISGKKLGLTKQR